MTGEDNWLPVRGKFDIDGKFDVDYVYVTKCDAVVHRVTGATPVSAGDNFPYEPDHMVQLPGIDVPLDNPKVPASSLFTAHEIFAKLADSSRPRAVDEHVEGLRDRGERYYGSSRAPSDFARWGGRFVETSDSVVKGVVFDQGKHLGSKTPSDPGRRSKRRTVSDPDDIEKLNALKERLREKLKD